MLGTLITSITSFYFASKTAEAASSAKPQPPSAAPTAPVVTSVDPKEVSVSELPREITVSGADLLDANAVSLKNKTGTVITVSPQDILSSDTTLRFKTPIGLTSDTWTITIKKRDGGENSLADAISVT
jgi:outer membrane receptor protein involved in Fe transport